MFSFFKKYFKANFIDEKREKQAKDIEKRPKVFWGAILSGEDCDQLSNSSGELGHSPTNPILVNSMIGEINYLNSLRCACGGNAIISQVRFYGGGFD